MSRNKEALVLLLDVGPSMHHILPQVEKLCSMLVQKKMIYSKNDEVGVILFGTADTENELAKEIGGYEHVVVLRHIKVVDGDTIEALQQLPRGNSSGDFLDAIVVGMDMLITKFGETNKGKKRLCLITNAIVPIKLPYEGTKEDQVDTIAAQMATHGMKMDCVVVRGKQVGDENKRIMEDNDALLKIFSKRTSSKTVYVESPTSLLGALRTRKVSPVTIYRGDFELGPDLKIKIWVYKKTSEEKFPTLKKYSDKTPEADEFANHETKVEAEYKIFKDSAKTIPPEQRIKGYSYGPQVVPVSPDVLEAVKFRPEKGVKLLGVTDGSNIPRHYYMKDVNIFIPDPNDTNAIVAVSALASAMKELNKVAIVRCVWRQGQGNVVVGVLTPNLSDNDNVPDSFYFNVLPFADDVREFQFPSFSKFPSSMQPNEQQQEAADNLVRMLDLAPPGKEEVLWPDFTPNPSLQRFYNHLELKSKHLDAAVPLLDETLKRITEPDPELFLESKCVINDFCRHFEVKENPKLKKSTRRLIREKTHGLSEDGDDLGNNYDAQTFNGAKSKSAVEDDQIGDVTPVQDFEAMMSHRDNPEWVGKAIRGMKNKILTMVEDSFEGDTYEKALQCLVALRKGCILEQEPKHFNDFLYYLSEFCQRNELNDFMELLASKDLRLIIKTEAEDSEVTEDEASSFMAKKQIQ